MILTVTPNAALDLTYQVPALQPGATHRVAAVAERPGGKGVNVARVLHGLGEPTVATGFAGGGTGARIRALLAVEGVREALVPVAGESRRTVVVTDAAGATGFWEPGPAVSPAEWSALRRRYRALLGVARVAVLSGSLPAGAAGYGPLIDDARAYGVPVILDADGDALRDGLRCRPDLVTPNVDELAALLGRPRVDPADGRSMVAALREVRALGAREVVATLGGAGLAVATAAGAWRAFLPAPLAGNASGSGDACAAALAIGLAHRRPWPERLVDAVALSAAAVASPVAGSVPLDRWRALRPLVTVQEL